MKALMIFLMAITMFGCQDEKKEPEIRLADYDQPYTANDSTTEKPESKTTADDANAEVVEITIKGDDKMTFNKSVLKVPAGSTVRLTLIHTGTLPAVAMGHDVVILKPNTDVAAFAMKALKFPDNNYVPKNSSKVIAHTKIIGGGESTTIEFKAPPVGTYPFICSFPGHYTMMKGDFIVE